MGSACDQHRRLHWGNALDGVALESGLHEFCCTLPTLPSAAWRLFLARLAL